MTSTTAPTAPIAPAHDERVTLDETGGLGILDLGRIAGRGLASRRVRSGLTALGIAIGIAAMVAVVGISASSRADVLAEIDALGTGLLRAAPGRTAFGDDATLPDTARQTAGRIGPVLGASGLTFVDATVRLLPGAMSDLDSARGDSFFDRQLSAPSYTRPPVFRGHAVPDVLLSGDHKKIAEWREQEGRRLSEERGLNRVLP